MLNLHIGIGVRESGAPPPPPAAPGFDLTPSWASKRAGGGLGQHSCRRRLQKLGKRPRRAPAHTNRSCGTPGGRRRGGPFARCVRVASAVGACHLNTFANPGPTTFPSLLQRPYSCLATVRIWAPSPFPTMPRLHVSAPLHGSADPDAIFDARFSTWASFLCVWLCSPAGVPLSLSSPPGDSRQRQKRRALAGAASHTGSGPADGPVRRNTTPDRLGPPPSPPLACSYIPKVARMQLEATSAKGIAELHQVAVLATTAGLP
jgi:hypothetical protein